MQWKLLRGTTIRDSCTPRVTYEKTSVFASSSVANQFQLNARIRKWPIPERACQTTGDRKQEFSITPPIKMHKGIIYLTESAVVGIFTFTLKGVYCSEIWCSLLFLFHFRDANNKSRKKSGLVATPALLKTSYLQICVFRFVLCALPSDRRELHKLIYERSLIGKGMLTIKSLSGSSTSWQNVSFQCGQFIKKTSMAVNAITLFFCKTTIHENQVELSGDAKKVAVNPFPRQACTASKKWEIKSSFKYVQFRVEYFVHVCCYWSVALEWAPFLMNLKTKKTPSIYYEPNSSLFIFQIYDSCAYLVRGPLPGLQKKIRRSCIRKPIISIYCFKSRFNLVP